MDSKEVKPSRGIGEERDCGAFPNRPTIQPGNWLRGWAPILSYGAGGDDILLLNDAVYVGFDIDNVGPWSHFAAVLVFAIPEESVIRRHLFADKNRFDSSSFNIEKLKVYQP